MNLRGVTSGSSTQKRFVLVQLVLEWCLMRVVYSKLKVVSGIDNSNDLNNLGNSGKTHLKKRGLQPGLRVLILKIYG
jgi:hypothetical protein